MKNDFMTLAKERYSVRKFTQQKVEQEKIDLILESGLVAPTAANRQPQKILVLTRETDLEKLKKCTRSHFDAPLAFIICYDAERSWKRSFDGQDSGFVDGSIVTTHMMMEAWELGIGSTWVMAFDPAAVKEQYALPDSVIPVAILPMGYPHPDAQPSPMHRQVRDLADTLL